MIHTKGHLISPGCHWPSIALQYIMGAWRIIHFLFIKCKWANYPWKWNENQKKREKKKNPNKQKGYWTSRAGLFPIFLRIPKPPWVCCCAVVRKLYGKSFLIVLTVYTHASKGCQASTSEEKRYNIKSYQGESTLLWVRFSFLFACILGVALLFFTF